MKDILDLHTTMLAMKLSLVMLLVAPSVIVNSTTGTYWWLGRAAFGGRNYNLEDIANNVHNQETPNMSPPDNHQSDADSEHIFDFLNDSEELVKNSERVEHKPNIEIMVTENPTNNKRKKLKRVKNRGKRQIRRRDRLGRGREDDLDILDRKNELESLRLDEIETECPVTLTCATRRVCDTRGKVNRDLIPCLDQITGRIEVCCDKFFPSMCPEVRMVPPAENCVGELDECDNVGSFCSENHLCCFNGCKNICLEDPPLVVDTSFFFRAPAEVVNIGEPRSPGDDDEEDYDNNEPVPQLLDDDQDFGFKKESSEITIPISLVEKISELLITLKDEEEKEEHQNSPLIDQIELILSSVEKESKERTPRLINRRTNRPRRRHRKSRRKGIV